MLRFLYRHPYNTGRKHVLDVNMALIAEAFDIPNLLEAATASFSSRHRLEDGEYNHEACIKSWYKSSSRKANTPLGKAIAVATLFTECDYILHDESCYFSLVDLSKYMKNIEECPVFAVDLMLQLKRVQGIMKEQLTDELDYGDDEDEERYRRELHPLKRRHIKFKDEE